MAPDRRVPFAAGQSRVYVVDLNAAEYPARAYVAHGSYNGREVVAPFRVLP